MGPRIVDETQLSAGIRNIAQTYFDTTSLAGKHKKSFKHMSFQTVLGKDWKDAVADIMLETKEGLLKTVREQGGETLKKMISGTIQVAEGTSLSQAAANIIAEMVVDKATAKFSNKQPAEEAYLEGTWVYIDREKTVSRLHLAEEEAGEVSMFGDADDILTREIAKHTYTAGFYINHERTTNACQVYCFDTQQPETLSYTHVRRASPEDAARFDELSSMTYVRELFFMKAKEDNVAYAKFQLGDEVFFNNRPYSCVEADALSITLQDSRGNRITVDPQACRKGESDHWKATQPGMFRTAEFTFAPGDYAYREIGAPDEVANVHASGILMMITRCLNEKTVEGIDVYSGKAVSTDPLQLIKPPLVYRKTLSTDKYFVAFRRIALSGKQTHGVVKGSSDSKRICYGYKLNLDFANRRGLVTIDVPQGEPKIFAEDSTVVWPEEDKVIDKSAKKGEGVGFGAFAVVGILGYFMLFS